MNKRGVKRVILFILDSFRPDYLAMYDLPHLRNLVFDGVYYGNARGVMPATTTTNHTTILTGAFPKNTRIPNNCKYDRVLDRIVGPLRDIRVPMLPEMLAAKGKVSVEHGHFLLEGRNVISLKKGVANFKRGIEVYDPDLVVYMEMDADTAGHSLGPWGVGDCVTKLDATIGEMLGYLEATKLRDTTAIVIASDHLMGQGHNTGLAEGMTRKLQQAGFVFSLSNEEIRDDTDIVIVPSGSMFFYLRTGRFTEERYATLLDILRLTPHVDILEAEGLRELNLEPFDVGDIGIFPHYGYSMYPCTGLGIHGRPSEQQITLILSGAGIKEGVTLGDANSVDIAPTILELLEVEIPGTVDGVPLYEALKPIRNLALS